MPSSGNSRGRPLFEGRTAVRDDEIEIYEDVWVPETLSWLVRRLFDIR